VAVEVHVVTPEREVWSGEAELVIARGVDGEVGILKDHAPLLIQLAIGPLRIQQQDGSESRAAVDGGFMHVSSGEEGTRVDVMAVGASLQDEIDGEGERARAAELEERLRSSDDERQQEEIRAELRKAQVRATLAG
jgi:F-type H+-transporting ATPase subunit epsilon